MSMSVEDKYSELLNAVSSKYSNESRHGTALRYIKSSDGHGIVPEETNVDKKLSDFALGKKCGMGIAYCMADRLIHTDNGSEYNLALQDLKSKISIECKGIFHDSK